jgi:hypothetical protein
MDVKNEGKTPVLLTQSKYDPSTSFVWAEGARKQFEEEAFVLRNGDGHTSYLLFGEASRIVDEYLVNLTVPEANLVVDT